MISDISAQAPEETRKSLLGPRPTGQLTRNVLQFIELVLGGCGKAEAYRIAFGHPKMITAEAGDRAWKVLIRPIVKWELARLQLKADKKTLLTLNERQAMLAGIIQDEKTRPADRIKAIEVYSKLGGDGSSTVNVNLRGGGPGGSIPISGSVGITGMVGTTPLSRRERLQLLKERRQERERAENESIAESQSRISGPGQPAGGQSAGPAAS